MAQAARPVTAEEHRERGEKLLARAEHELAQPHFPDFNERRAQALSAVASAHFLAAMAARP